MWVGRGFGVCGIRYRCGAPSWPFQPEILGCRWPSHRGWSSSHYPRSHTSGGDGFRGWRVRNSHHSSRTSTSPPFVTYGRSFFTESCGISSAFFSRTCAGAKRSSGIFAASFVSCRCGFVNLQSGSGIENWILLVNCWCDFVTTLNKRF